MMARPRTLITLLLLALFAVVVFTRCNTCLLTRSHTGHDTCARKAGDLPPGVTTYTATFEGRSITVYQFGSAGPPVLLFHELPGFSEETIRLAQIIQAAGYQVHAPLLFGGFGESSSGIGRTVEACRSGFVHCWSGDSMPLVRFAHEEILAKKVNGQPAVIIGMCLTGNAAAQMLSYEPKHPIAGVIMSQPAMPFPLTHSQMRATGLQDVQKIIGKVPILAFRFTHDCISPPQRMEEFERVFKQQITVIQIDSGPCNHMGLPTSAHAVLTQEYRPSEPLHPTNDAVRRVLAFLDATLNGGKSHGQATR